MFVAGIELPPKGGQVFPSVGEPHCALRELSTRADADENCARLLGRVCREVNLRRGTHKRPVTATAKAQLVLSHE